MAYGRFGWSERVSTSLTHAIDKSDKSLNKIAEETGIPLSTLFRRYRAQNPWDTQQIEAVATALDANLDDLLRADVEAS